jgi:hypothetical protein
MKVRKKSAAKKQIAIAGEIPSRSRKAAERVVEIARGDTIRGLPPAARKESSLGH